MTTKGETRIPIGDNFYLTFTEFKGEPKVHIRLFITVSSLFKKPKSTIFPTKVGVTLTTDQFKACAEVLQGVVPQLFGDPPAEPLAPFSLGSDLYLTL